MHGGRRCPYQVQETTTIAATAPTFVPFSRATTDTTDPDLVAAVRRGDDQAFELLYERYHRRIAAYIYGMVGDYGRAEDIAQDVFMSALRRMRETDRPIAFKPWIYEIAKNACIDQFRRSRRAEEVSYDADEGLGAADYGRLVTTGPTPDVAVDQKMSIDHLRGAFGGLSDTHHQILVMRELEGLSYREIGERLGMSRPSVESTLFRARRRLSEEYEDLVSGERCSRVQLIITQASGGALGARDQRKLGKHVAHCQSCRREARIAGLDGALLAPQPVRSRIAAFLPLPAFLKRRLENDDAGIGNSGVAVGHHAPTLAQWSAQISATVDPAIAGWAKAAAAAATIAVAGVGASTVGGGDERLDLRTALPSHAVTKALKTERGLAAAAPASSRRSSQRTGSTGAGPTKGSRGATGSGGASAGTPGLPGTTSDAARDASPITPLVGGSGAGSTGTGAGGDATVPGLPISGGDGTDRPTGSRPVSGEQDVTKEVGKAVTSAPSLVPGASLPAGSSTEDSTGRDSVESAVGGAATAVADALQP